MIARWIDLIALKLLVGIVLEQVGLYLSIIVGSVGVVAQVAGGAAADCMYARTNDLRWYAWVPAMTSSMATPFAIACYYATSDMTSFVLFIVPTLAANSFDAPVQHSWPSVNTTQPLSAIVWHIHMLC